MIIFKSINNLSSLLISSKIYYGYVFVFNYNNYNYDYGDDYNICCFKY